MVFQLHCNKKICRIVYFTNVTLSAVSAYGMFLLIFWAKTVLKKWVREVHSPAPLRDCISNRYKRLGKMSDWRNRVFLVKIRFNPEIY